MSILYSISIFISSMFSFKHFCTQFFLKNISAWDSETNTKPFLNTKSHYECFGKAIVPLWGFLWFLIWILINSSNRDGGNALIHSLTWSWTVSLLHFFSIWSAAVKIHFPIHFYDLAQARVAKKKPVMINGAKNERLCSECVAALRPSCAAFTASCPTHYYNNVASGYGL